MNQKLQQIAEEDGRYEPEAVKFVYEGLSYTIENYADEPSHVSGELLCTGLKELAIKRWGRLAKLVLNDWGIKGTRDFGEIVYLMIEHKWMSAQPGDTIDDFNDVFGFQKTFVDGFSF